LLIVRRIKGAFNRRFPVPSGIRYAFHFNGFRCLLHFIYCRKIRRQNTFFIQGEPYHYFDTIKTWHGERAVEIPIIMDKVRKYRGKNILEIGNVLSHHIRLQHDILDKYEKSTGVINDDVVNYRSEKKYDLIVSISTLEHVGWDENPRDDTKILRAIENLKTLIGFHGGMIVITLPVGYNPVLDQLLRDGTLHFSKQFNLLRISRGNEWKESNWEDVSVVKYNSPMPFANGLIIGIILVNTSI